MEAKAVQIYNYDCIIRHIDEQGNLLSSLPGSFRKNAWITIEAGMFEGYQFVDGAVGKRAVRLKYITKY